MAAPADTLVTKLILVDGKIVVDDCPFEELHMEPPVEAWVLKNGNGFYACLSAKRVHGLCAFVEEETAIKWVEAMQLPGMKPERVTHKQLIEVARGRAIHIKAIHYFESGVVNPDYTFYFR